MPSKQKQPEYDEVEVVTFLRLVNGLSVLELLELHYHLRDTPISGDAIRVFRSLAETSKMSNNRGMDINQLPLTLGPLVPFLGEFTTPAWVDVTVLADESDPTSAHLVFRFTFSQELNCYLDTEGNELYIEPTQTDGTLTPDAYWEMPESM